jgi:hypothetical protein
MPLPLPHPHPIIDELTVLIAHRFRLLGEPMRLRLLELAAFVGDFADRPFALTPQCME